MNKLSDSGLIHFKGSGREVVRGAVGLMAVGLEPLESRDDSVVGPVYRGIPACREEAEGYQAVGVALEPQEGPSSFDGVAMSIVNLRWLRYVELAQSIPNDLA